MMINPTTITLSELLAWRYRARSQRGVLLPWGIQSSTSGPTLSRIRGRGMMFEEVRAYQPGDDVNTMDWRVTARMQQPHTKVYLEEKARTVLLCVDLRQSMFFSSQQAFKSVLAAHFIAAQAWQAHHRGDQVGGCIFDETNCHVLPPKLGVTQICHYLKTLAAFPAWLAPNHASTSTQQGLKQALQQMRRFVRCGTRNIWASDWPMADIPLIRQYYHRPKGAQSLWLQLYDPLEKTLPPAGIYPIKHQSRHFMLNTGSRKARRAYTEDFQSQQHARQQLAKRLGATWLVKSTQAPLLTTVQAGVCNDK